MGSWSSEGDAEPLIERVFTRYTYSAPRLPAEFLISGRRMIRHVKSVCNCFTPTQMLAFFERIQEQMLVKVFSELPDRNSKLHEHNVMRASLQA